LTVPGLELRPLGRPASSQSLYRLSYPGSVRCFIGRAIAQAVSRRLPTAAAQFRSQDRSCEICGGQNGTGAGLFQVLRFSLPILIPPTTPHSSSTIRGWYNRPNIGRRTKWTQSHSTPRNKKKKKNWVFHTV
jgi:hypothetical protein